MYSGQGRRDLHNRQGRSTGSGGGGDGREDEYEELQLEGNDLINRSHGLIGSPAREWKRPSASLRRG